MKRPTALLAEDEALLAASLKAMLAAGWPELDVIAEAEDGLSATALALAQAPDVLFLDIRMPGASGLDVATAVADEWPGERPLPLFVFVTAYDEFAVQAFEREAVDYVLKPVTPERLSRTITRLRQRLAERDGGGAGGAARAGALPDQGELARVVRQLQALAGGQADGRVDGRVDGDPVSDRLDVIQAGIGNTVRMIPIEDVIYFEAADKYLNVVTRDGEALIRMSMRELVARLRGDAFVQIHRGVMVNRRKIRQATREESGRVTLTLADVARPIPVSRAFAHLFRAM